MLYIMRHGKTDWNAKYKMQGRTDIPLNEEGRAMARAAREKYKDIAIDICYSSPLLRAKETAEIFLEGREVPILLDDRLMEMSFGAAEGTENVFSKPDLAVYRLFKDPVNYVAEAGAESFEELFARTGEFLAEVAEPLLAQGKNVLIVGHGAMNSSIINRVRGIPLERFWETLGGNCELVELREYPVSGTR